MEPEEIYRYLEKLLKELEESLKHQDAEIRARFETLTSVWQKAFQKQQNAFDARFQELEEGWPKNSPSKDGPPGISIHLNSGMRMFFPDPIVTWAGMTTISRSTAEKMDWVENQKDITDIEKTIKGIFFNKSP